MPLRPGIFCALLLAGCATHAEQPAPQAQTGPAASSGVPGIILAMRPVRAEGPGPARVLLAGLGTPGTLSADDVYEFIVRTDSGTTISIVQPRTNGLRRGEHVRILRGAETRIETPATD
jgi:outer membrane lipoprotein SlyB